ncbi:hypothetical protein BDW60DRAFT_207369 [Aspergillus nidulans var. acristatus]
MGLNCRVFESPNAQYTDFVTILRRPGFPPLDLSLLVRLQERMSWPAYGNGYLRRALEGAHCLERTGLSTNIEENPASDTFLGAMVVDDITSFLSVLPPTLLSVLLGILYFIDHGGPYREFLTDMRDKLDWRSRDPVDRPVVSLAKLTVYHLIGHAVWLGHEVQAFLYREGENPLYGCGIGVGKKW